MMNKGKRLIPEDLLDYVQNLNNNHPDPSAEWGNTYTAGTGIDITGAEISVDNTVATKTFVENYAEPSAYLFEFHNADHGQLTQQQIQKLQSLGLDAMGKKILVDDGMTSVVFIIDWMQPKDFSDPNNYTYGAHNAGAIGISSTATWYGISYFNTLTINEDPDTDYTWNWGFANFDLPLSSTDFTRDPDTYDICISSSIARTSAIPTVTSSITQGSTDAVTSGAVYNAIGDIESLLAAI